MQITILGKCRNGRVLWYHKTLAHMRNCGSSYLPLPTEHILPCGFPTYRVSCLYTGVPSAAQNFVASIDKNINAWIINYTGCSASDISLLQDTSPEFTRKCRDKKKIKLGNSSIRNSENKILVIDQLNAQILCG